MEQYEEDIDLKEIGFLLLKKWKDILIAACILGLITAMFNQFIITPRYSASSEIYIFSQGIGTDIMDIQTSESLTKDYMRVAVGRTVLKKVVKNLDLNEDYHKLKKRIEVVNPEDTRILELTVIDESPEMAARIADELANVTVKYIEDKMDQECPSILENAEIDKKPIGPNKIKNTSLGFLAGAVLMSAYILIRNYMNETIMDAEVIEDYLELNVLAEVPESKSTFEKKSQKSKKRKGIR